MNYSKLMKGLMTEANSAKQYAILPTAMKVLAAIGIFPFAFAAFVYYLFYQAYAFIFNAIAASTAYLEGWVDEKRRDLHPASEAVLFFLTTPFIFFTHVILSLFAAAFFFLWFTLQCLLYIATLGGIRFTPYINNAGRDAGRELVITTSRLAAIVVAAIVFALFVLFLLLTIAEVDEASIILLPYLIFCVIAIPTTFRKKEVEEAPAEAAAPAATAAEE